MTMNVEGYVEMIETKPTSTGKTMYNVRVNGVSYGAGMYPPKFKQGDFISFTSTMNGRFNNMETRTVTVRTGVAPAPAYGGATRPAMAPRPATGNSAGWDERQDTISKQAALNSAQHMVEILVTAGAVVGLDKAKTPADKMKLLNVLVDEYTMDYYKQATGKTLVLEVDAPVEDEKPVDNWDS
jgi:hypothetical protein